jgi:hypothetical protein
MLELLVDNPDLSLSALFLNGYRINQNMKVNNTLEHWLNKFKNSRRDKQISGDNQFGNSYGVTHQTMTLCDEMWLITANMLLSHDTDENHRKTCHIH